MDSANHRKLYPTTHRKNIYIFENGKEYLNFSSNDYLNLGSNPALQKAFLQKMANEDCALFSSGSSRLLSGNSSPFAELEQFFSEWYGKEASLLFNSGYQANLGIISGLMHKDDVIFSDKLNHNSIISGILQSGADFYRYRHLDCGHLEDLLKKHRSKHKQALIVSETLFSMDGDFADLDALVYLKNKYSCLLMLDEAHAAGVYGNKAQGLCTENKNYLADADILMLALGKAFGSQGAVCTADKNIINTLTNKAPTFIFSTAISPIQVMWTKFLLTEHFDTLLAQKDKLRRLTEANGFSSQIVPHLVGESEECVSLSAHLREQGFFVLPVRPPTVPAHTARLRISLCADMRQEHIDSLFSAIKTYSEK